MANKRLNLQGPSSHIFVNSVMKAYAEVPKYY